ncbi:hypothetical protein GJ496_008254 [Pomphorhynchus laevis]|nr:hypothetical protein GJ496_008254 [Pomphorhynchus laevis]
MFLSLLKRTINTYSEQDFKDIFKVYQRYDSKGINIYKSRKTTQNNNEHLQEAIIYKGQSFAVSSSILALNFHNLKRGINMRRRLILRIYSKRIFKPSIKSTFTYRCVQTIPLSKWRSLDVSNECLLTKNCTILIKACNNANELLNFHMLAIYHYNYDTKSVDRGSQNHKDLSRPPYRRRRSIDNNIPSTSCCKPRNMFVDFKNVKWDHAILYPTSYNVGLCSGSCNVMSLPKWKNLAILKHLLSHTNQDTSLAPTCVPVKTRSLKVIRIRRDNRLSIVFLPDMIVERCECV